MFAAIGTRFLLAALLLSGAAHGATTCTVPQGCTGRATGTTAYGLIAVGTTATGTQQTITPGASGDVLVAAGASALATWVSPTGTGAPAKANSPALSAPTATTSLATTSTSFGLLNENATTVSAFGAATTLRIGGATGTAILANTTTQANALTATTFNGNTITSGTGTLTFTGAAVATVSTTLSVGYINIPVYSKSASYTTILGDAGTMIFHPSTDTNARTYTIDSNANVAYVVGTCISFSNLTANVVSIVVTSDTMYLASTGTTGTRSLAQYGIATACKLTSTIWIISGAGLTYWKPDDWLTLPANDSDWKIAA